MTSSPGSQGAARRLAGELQDQVFPHLREALFHRKVWRGFVDVVNANDELPPSIWWDFARTTYANSQSMAVRRLAQSSSDRNPVVSIATVLDGLTHHALEIRASEIYSPETPPDDGFTARLQADWLENFGTPGCDHLNPRVTRSQRELLGSVCQPVVRHVNKYVAHVDLKSSRDTPTATLNELNAAIDELAAAFRFSARILGLGDYMLDDDNLIIPGDWQALFRVPWAK